MERWVKKGSALLVGMCTVLILGACSDDPSPQQQIYSSLEKVVAQEKGFLNQQEPLVNLEKEEKGIYDQIIALGMKEHDQIKGLSDDALELIDKREKHLQKEKESIHASKKKFDAITKRIDSLEDAKLKEQAEQLKDVMEKRYASYDRLYANYEQSITLDRDLYKMFQKDEVTLDELEKQITSINETYDKIVKENKVFNDLTKKYNDDKEQFYKKAGIESSK
ncbi:YkyA family protein [Priestia koreensis]|uniref:YkyA family protein n=1 Tax=Priestia koreensis TaxID=284581 RepID=UPI001F596E36|nr:YkyA family protein [Priestia koreensis]